MTKDIDQEIARLLKIKEEVDNINNFIKNNNKVRVVSQHVFSVFSSQKILKPDIFYYVVDEEVGQYIEGFID